MSENENVSGTTGNTGHTGHTGHAGTSGAGNAWGWEPVPQGGEYDSEATAFVQLPQEMLDALDRGEPLAAPGHGFVPPPMIVPLGSGSADPSATGTWTMPVQWPEAGSGTGPADPAGAGAAAARAPIPASIPLPASVAAAFGAPAPAGEAEAEPQGGRHGDTLGGGLHLHGDPHATPHGVPYGVPHADPDPGSTAEWHFPEAVHQPEDHMATGQWTLPGGAAGTGPDAGPDAGWGRAPATLPGGASAPWAPHEIPEAPDAGHGVLLSSGVLPGVSAGAPAAGALGRGPRVLGGPGVGTPLPEAYLQAGPEPEAVPAAAPDIEASHGPAEIPVEGERPRPVEAEDVADAGGAQDAAGAGGTGHGFAQAPAAPAGAEAAPVPGDGGADSGATPPGEGGTGGFPGQEATYEEEGGPAVAHHEHPAASYVLRVNGADRPVTGAWIGESLLYVLRERLGLAGAKDGCSQGECGACAVQVDGRLVASCLVPAATAAGSEVRTVEGLATGGELSDVQQALCRSGGVQCGFCVPGMAMTIHDLLEGNHAPSDLETRQALCGNLCRCSGYKGVIEAVHEVVAEREAAASAAADATVPGIEPRIPHQAQPGEGSIHGTPQVPDLAGGTGGPAAFDTFGGNHGVGGFETPGGFDGFNGATGFNGPDGLNGLNGPDGFDGPAGPNGDQQHNGGMA
ncbi:(2Fe-2S)-binding protein [Streptomyces sp. NBC_00091]|uniref:(2Fe-2S)-binding protein n=1 Tax=Streptomyces sp. NBC_00091 TaxID=2975648 RepID=UPI00225B2FA7|nr:2Fe-2S iron-sulfur cluster-binding protein [Streptomyces sp. NBC_00091]MCX5378116.1 (2Fe-2S)-binding protein [Streptomyces sp. NBC_00091]